MKKSLRLALLCAAVLLCVGVYVLLPQNAEETAPTPEPTALPVFSIAPDEIAGLRWSYALRTIDLRQIGGTWQYPEDEHFPLDRDGSRFQSLLAALEHVTAGRRLPDAADLSEYGLDAPATVITVTHTDGAETTLTVGAQNPVTLEYYLRVSDRGGVYLIDGTLPQAFNCGLFDLIRTDEIPDLSTAEEYRVNGQTYRKNESGAWCNSSGDPINTDLTAVLSALTYDECIDYYADYYEAHHEYALEGGKTVSVTYLVNGEPAEWSLAFSHDYDEGHVIVSPVGSDLVYTIDKATADTLLLQ